MFITVPAHDNAILRVYEVSACTWVITCADAYLCVCHIYSTVGRSIGDIYIQPDVNTINVRIFAGNKFRGRGTYTYR